MQMTLRRLALLALSAGFACQAPAQASVIDYVKIPDKEYRWELKSKTETPEGTVYDLHLVSQVWQGGEWKVEVRRFVVSGGSKRGWTTWLTGASDARVKAIAPLVIDTLNMKAQMDHQLKSYGKYSLMIRDYTNRGLVPMPKTEEAVKLWQMVDPYFYRDQLKMPTLIVNGANDPYWTVDALNLYWDGLKGEKWVLYVPNA